jgi:hypothetical protein
MHSIILGLLLVCGAADAADAPQWKVGVGRAAITPDAPMWLCGYASRKHPSEGIVHDLWAKALAIEDSQGGRVVIVTTDVIGLPREVTEEVASRLAKQHGLARSQIVFNSSHTHCGPAVWPGLPVMFDFSPEEQKQAEQYSARVTDVLVAVVAAALKDESPARLAFGRGSAGFGMNRRAPAPQGIRLAENPKGPVDHEVPVVSIRRPDGELRAVLTGYACHGTTLGGDCYQINGDYAGYAQIELEKAHPGATAMCLALCGGDQNPNPRGKLEMAAEHGKTLAAEVERVLGGSLRPVRPPVATAYQVVELEFTPHERAAFEKEAECTHVFRQRRARRMLAAYDAGKPVRQIQYPVQAVRFDGDLTLIALAGEVVVDYALRLKSEFPKENLIVAGYSNDIPCYIPSLRVLREGGYESVDSMIYYGQPGPFAENVEERVLRACREALGKLIPSQKE